MAKSATTIEKQLEILESRGLTILDKDKAKEILLDVGYYRLGFYLFPFEESYPSLSHRTHKFVDGSTIEDAVRLYYFDFDLRLMLMRYLNRIEIAFRTAMIYTLSNKYNADSVWFVNPAIVSRSYAENFGRKVYTSDFKRNPVITRHHQKHPSDTYAPAWKTLEFMTFGAVMKLYEQLKDPADKIKIANQFGIRQVVTFESYMHTIRNVRNACAHGSLLYDLKLPLAIRRGPAANPTSDRNNIIGALYVIKYVMSQISENRANDMIDSIRTLYNNLVANAPSLKPLIPDFSLS
ncbi:MAG: Abi family protein [Lachnospiraceae bacterium]|nr:Abi family protein [Lachnospiraceae bacterium]